DWYIIDHLAADTFGVPGIDYTEISSTDTTWGNEIIYLWDAAGEFDILVYVTTEHGCDTTEQGRVKVFDLPIAQAGSDEVQCNFDDYQLHSDSAWNFSVIYWGSTGDGVFSDPYSFHPVYSFGPTDSLMGTVTLFLTAEGLADNGTCEPDIDSITIDVSSPDIIFDPYDPLCYNDSTGYILANISGGRPPYSFEWTGPAGLVSINSDSIGGLWAGTYILTVTDDNGCTDTDSVELFYPPELLLTIDSVQNISCYGYSDGAIYSSASGGIGSIQFYWEGLLGYTYTGNNILNIPADTYLVTATDENGCSKVETVILPQPDSILAIIDVSDSLICEGETTLLTGITMGGTGSFTYQWSGSGALFLDADTTKDVVFENAPEGDYLLIFTITDEANCEASDSMTITVYPPTYSYDSLEVCAGSPSFTWNHRTVTSDMDRIYTDTLIGANQYGCDSILTLDVKVLFPEYYEDTIYVCENDVPYEPYGNITIYPDHDSIYLDTVRYTSSGCDSLLITISVYSLPVTDTLLESTLCAGAPEFLWNNRWIQTDSSQIYLDTLVNSYGCDSLLTYDITILPPDTFYVDTIFCQDEPEFVWNGITILTAFDSIYEATLTNSFGCDSIVNLNVQLLPVTDTTIDTLLCYNTPPYAWNNLVIFAEHDSTYLDTLVNQYGCDSLLTLNVTVIYPDTVNLDTTLCEGTPEFAWNSHTVDVWNDSIYTELLQNQYGCDSIVNLDVRILRPAYESDTMEVCESEPAFAWYSHTILTDRDSIYYDTLYYDAGCDSLRLQLEIITLPVSDTLLDTTLCEASPEFVWNSHTISTYKDSTYLDTLTNVYGCDSTITLNVYIVPGFKDTSQLAVCFGEPVTPWYGQAISSESDSIYFHQIPDPFGCDTLLYYEVSILPVTDTVLDSTLCAGLPDFMWNNRLISSVRDSIYLDTLVNSYGCDSLLTYVITVIPPDTFRTDTTLCYGDPDYDWNGITVSTLVETDYQAVLTNSVGCDSVVILTVNLINGTTRDTFIQACEEYTWFDGTGDTYTSSGTYLFAESAGAGCADSVWLHLTISQPFFVIPDQTNVLCYGDSTGAIDLTVSGGIKPYSYLWGPGGETTQDLADLPAGTYSIVITDSIGCTWDSPFVITEPTEIQITLDAITDVLVNGTSTGSIEVSVSGGTPGYTYEWTDAAGTVVGTDEDLYNQPAGDYTLTVTDANNCVSSDTYTITEPEITVCLNDTTFSCYEDLANYPLITSLEDYVALLQPGQVIAPGCGIDTSSFSATVTIDPGSAYCYEEIRFYSLLDDCGDTLFSCEQHVIVNDTEKPTISCPPTITVVNDVVPAAYADTSEFRAAGGTFDDNCAVVSFRQVGGDVSLGGTDPERYQRTYEVEDYCGNTRTCTQIIEVYLSFDFTIECDGLPTETFECKGDLPHYTLQSFRDDGGYAYSNPLPITKFYYTDRSNNQTCPETITRTFYIVNAMDTVSCDKIYVIDDKTPPTLILPDKYITCAENWPVYSNYVDVLRYRDSHGNDAFDNCGNSSIRSVSLVSSKQVETCPTVYERVYRIRDYCGNFSLETERIIVEEQPLEVVSAPLPLNEDCFLPNPYTTIAQFEADGGKVRAYCGAPLTFDYINDVAVEDEPGVVYRTYRFWDNCDSVDVVQKITIIDSIPPVLSCPPADTLAPGESFPDNPFVTLDEFLAANGFAEDNCTLDSTSLTLVGQDSIVGDCEKQYIYTFIIADISGNWSEECDHIIYQIDQSDPQLTCPQGITVQCIDDVPAIYTTLAQFEADGGVATDDYELDPATFRFVSQTISSTTCPTIITRTYEIQDLCGKQTTCDQYITVNDTIPPTISCPPNDTAVCLSSTVADIHTLDEFISMGGNVDDNCEIDPSSFKREVIQTIKLIDRTEITIEYFIADLCGNENSCIQSIILTDTIPPDPNCNEITVYLDEEGNYLLIEIDMDNISAGSSDNCTATEDLIIDVIPEAVTCEDVEEGKEVTVIVTDEAGNWNNCTANIRVVDTIPPVALCKPVTIYLDEYGRAGITVDMINDGSYDNCTDVSLELNKSDFDCTNLGDNTVTLTVRDAYGMESSCEATVTVLDTISPQISCIPPGDTIQLGSDGTYTLSYEMINHSEWENCEIVTRELDKYILDCNNIGITDITAIATDQSGNVGTCTTSFIIIGNTPPNVQNDSAITAINVPVDINVVLNDYDLKTNINLSTLGIVNGPSHGRVSVDNTTGIVTYTPNLNYVGNDIFRYTICDDGIPCIPECGEAIVFVTVRPANQPPIAVDDYYDLPCGVDLNGNVKVNDTDPDGDNTFVDLILLTLPNNGTAMMLDEYGNFSYSPNLDFKEGVDSFQYILFDDGIPSLSDTAWVYITKVPDNDCDGVADIDDIDDDNDGIRDNIENGGFWPEDPNGVLIDSDQDGIPDYLDVDSDNDGILDNIEGQAEDNFIDPVGWRDDNHNGWDDRYDNEEGGYPFDEFLTDTDGDGTPDYLDSDSDNDGVYDFIEGNDEIGPNFIGDGIPDIIRMYTDLDFDGLDDAYDFIDGWGNYVDNESGSLSPLQDSDGDGTRDWRDVNDEDDEYLTHNEDINGDGDYSNDDLDLDGTPEYLDTEMECDLFIPEGFSPNDDGVHDFFQILCIYPRYPNAKMMIFNRNGQKLWEKEHYGNYDIWGWNDAWWWGNSENRFTIGRAGGLPAGNYIYVLELNDGLGGVRNGTVMIAY
ncbi:MAG TPA: Ig-like domain-containing protein, partial [Draconibacterium sp.]|nr:Ig-like domain-containing protein [Draconibacterium sp.]